jgi:hypothetical protein
MRVRFVLLVCSLGLAMLANAQTKNDGPELMLVFSYKVKPEMRAEFEAVQKDVTAAFRKAEVPSRMVMQTVLGDMNEYVTVTPLPKFAAMDGPTPVARAIGEEQAAKLQHRNRTTITGAHRLVTVARPEFSIDGPAEQPGELALVITLHPVPGRAFEMEEMMKTEILAACKKAGVKHMWVSDVVFGGTAGTKIIVMPVSKMADFDQPSPFARALGPEGARKLAIKMGPMIASEEFAVYRLRTDLSHLGQAQRAAATAQK